MRGGTVPTERGDCPLQGGGQGEGLSLADGCPWRAVVDAVSISLNAPTAEEYVAPFRPKFGLVAYAALLRFGAEMKACVPLRSRSSACPRGLWR